MEEKRRRGVITVLLLGASVLVFLLLPKFAAGAADANKWHADPGRHASSPCPLPAPPPTAGADLPAQPPTHGQQQQQQQTAPHFGFPLQPPTLGASSAPPPGGEGYPFIGSNPTVPLPTGMTDTATVLPLPDTGDAAAGNKVVGLAASVRAHHQASSSMAMIGQLLFCLAILFLHGHY